MPEMEGKGLDYERYALNKLFRRMVRTHDIRSVLEMPAKGEKAMPSIYSIAFGEAGCDVTLVNAEEKSKYAWRELGYPVNYRECEDLTASGFETESYDLVWNFMTLPQHVRQSPYGTPLTVNPLSGCAAVTWCNFCLQNLKPFPQDLQA